MVPLRLPTGCSVVVSPAGGLQRIPWSALHDGPVAVVPAASMWNRTNRSPSANDSAALLIAGPQLPGAVDEVDRVGRSYRSPTVLRPPDSTIDAVVAAMAGADLVHLACHGRLRSDNPAFPALQLQDGLLTLHEMEIRGVAPQRIILAACDSAADAVYEGNEVLGFVSALLARGSRALVASIAVVPDAASVPLMLALHERLRNGDSFGDALFAARSTLDTEDPREFVNWCSFNAYGAA
jgi:CHAT domain-containing protein